MSKDEGTVDMDGSKDGEGWVRCGALVGVGGEKKARSWSERRRPAKRGLDICELVYSELI